MRYNLDNAAPSYKIIKSKKIYAFILEKYKEVQQFLLENFSMPQIYLEQLEELLDEIKLIKGQVLNWNQKLRT